MVLTPCLLSGAEYEAHKARADQANANKERLFEEAKDLGNIGDRGADSHLRSLENRIQVWHTTPSGSTTLQACCTPVCVCTVQLYNVQQLALGGVSDLVDISFAGLNQTISTTGEVIVSAVCRMWTSLA